MRESGQMRVIVGRHKKARARSISGWPQATERKSTLAPLSKSTAAFKSYYDELVEI